MKKLPSLLLALLMTLLLGSCKFISNTYTYWNNSKNFCTNLINKDYDQCIGLMAVETNRNINLDTLRTNMAAFRTIIVGNFGETPHYTFMNSQKTFTTVKEPDKNNTTLLIQLSNSKDFGVLKVVFDDNTRKILDINIIDKEPIPSMTKFWLFGLLALIVPAFNIYMIVRVKRSNLKTKWLKYLLIILLNVPAFTFKPVEGLSFGLFNFQVLLGISFSCLGYLGAAWTFGLPLGSFYVLWQLLNGRDKMSEPQIKQI